MNEAPWGPGLYTRLSTTISPCFTLIPFSLPVNSLGLPTLDTLYLRFLERSLRTKPFTLYIHYLRQSQYYHKEDACRPIYPASYNHYCCCAAPRSFIRGLRRAARVLVTPIEFLPTQIPEERLAHHIESFVPRGLPTRLSLVTII